MIPGLDGLRGIAFLLVFLVHTDYLSFGWTGVQLFFVLSGFLISGILVEMKRNLADKEFFVKFYGRRALRIIPLYYFYLLILDPLAAIIFYNVGMFGNRIEGFLNQIPYLLTFTYNFLTSDESSLFTGHLWTLSAEEQFYILWPLLIFFTPEKHLKKLFLGAILFAFLFRLIVSIVHAITPLPFMTNGVAYGIYALTFSHLDAFAMGALLSQQKLPHSTKQFFILAVILPSIGFAAQYIWTGNIGLLQTFGYPFLMVDAYQYVWGYSLLNYWFAVTIDAVAREGLLNRLLNSRPLVRLGRISYGMYVYHSMVIVLLYRLVGPAIQLPMPLAKIVLVPVQFAVVYSIASLSYRYIEKPFLDLKEKYFPVPKA